MLFEYLNDSIYRARVNSIGLTFLDLDSDSCVLDWTLTKVICTTRREEIIPAAKAATVLSCRVRILGCSTEPYQTAMFFLKFS